jgi:outer membrane protein assembly factor BamE (lipoprotein component of BamABCDE complex)
MVPRGTLGLQKRLNGQSIFGSTSKPAAIADRPVGFRCVEIGSSAGYVNASADARGKRKATREMTVFRQPGPQIAGFRPLATRLRAVAVIALVCAALTACTGEQFQKGYILPPGALEQIPIGASQDQVLIVMGTPSTVATLSGEVFYYISQRSERKVAFMQQSVVDQRVIAIYFDKNRTVQRVANYGLQDGKIFDFISRTTPTSGQEMSYLTPIFKLLSPN